jgi:hypothetical protein
MASELTEGKFVRYPHIEFISRLLAQAVMRGGARIILTCPPRHGKSWLVSRWLPAWYLSFFPEHSVILASYEATFAASWGRLVRNALQEYPRLGVKVSTDSSAADSWHTTAGGGMFTAGVGGPITGKGGNCFPGETRIFTTQGWVRIDAIHESKNRPLILSYNHHSQRVEWATILASSCRPGRASVVLYAGERRLRCTEEHPIWSAGAYRLARSFACGRSIPVFATST